MINKKLSSIILALLILASCFNFIALGAEDDITPLAVWDMSIALEPAPNGHYLKDSTSNGVDLNAYFGGKILPVGSSMGVTQNAIYPLNAGDYNFFEAKSKALAEPVLDALDGAFTFSTWINLDPEIITAESQFSSALFWVAEGANENFPIQLSISKQSGEDKAKLVLRRRFDVSERYFEVSEEIEIGEWTNIIISYDASSVDNIPLAVINGVTATAKHAEVVGTPSGAAKLHTENANLELGRTFSGSFQFLTGTAFAKTGFYGGNIAESKALEIYNAEKPFYENEVTDEDITTTDITPLSVWDMSTLNDKDIIDSTENNNDLYAYFGVNKASVGTCMYSSQNAVYPINANDFNFFEAKDKQKAESVLDALDSAFTFQTWIKLDPSVITLDKSFSSALFWVVDGANENFPIQLSFSKQSGNDKVYLVLRRKFDEGERYFEVSEGIKIGEWTNIIISYDASSINNTPLAVINGVVATAKHPEVMGVPSGLAKVHTEGSHTLELGRTFSSGAYQFLTGTAFAKTGFYGENITEAKAIETYNQEKVAYEAEFDVKMYDVFSNLIPAYEKDTLKESGNVITIDFSEINHDTVNSESVYIADTTENEWLSYTGTWNNDIYTISDFELEAGHSYQLVLKETILKADGNAFRSAEQTVDFKCDDEIALKEVVRWNAADAQITNGVGSIADDKYPLTIAWTDGFKNLHDVTYNTDRVLSATYSAYWAEGESGKALASELDGAITYETWVNILTDNRDTIALFSIGDLNDANHTTVWTGKDGNITFIRKYSQVQGYWFTEGGVLPRDKFTHFMITYDPATPEILPVIYVNGVKYTGKWTTASAPAGTPATSDNLTAPMVTVCSGTYNNAFTKVPGAWATSAIYKGVASEYDAYQKYMSEMSKYEKAYDIKILKADGSVYDIQSLNAISGASSLQIDLSGTNATAADIILTDKISGENVALNGAIDENGIYTASLSGIDNSDYTLTISKEILNAENVKVRTTDYTLDFSYNDVDFGVTSLKFADEIGNEFDNILNAYKVKAVAKIKNYTSQKVPYVYIAVYNKGTNKLTAVNMGTFKTGSSDTLETGYIEIPANSDVKVMLWDGDMKNLCSSFDFSK